MRPLFWIVPIAILCALTACQTTPPPPETVAVDENLSVREYIQRGMRYLEVGDETHARSDFGKALEKEPNNRTAQTMLEQIDADPEAYLGREHFTYTVQRGQALSVIAQRYLGSSQKFYILARYNGITNPSQIEVGQQLKIPGKPRAEPAPLKPSEEPPEDRAATRERPEPVRPSLESPPVAADDASKVVPAMAEPGGPVEASGPAVQTADETAVVTETIPPAAPAPVASLPAPESLPSKQDAEAERLYQRGVAEYQAGQLEKSYDTLNQALRLDPQNTAARQQVAVVKPALVDKYHKQALVLYKEQQNMCGAIRAWDKVLALDPNHSSALTYQDRAQRIATKLGQKCR
ncbi:MAG: LysM peptidoglycan-binding domain-containing protein [Gammaproteobacteria bacterium]|nr:LysM peptidoglycan-binding domain-containing protein [Gammaproteobacteria bacterium]MCP5426258.1 LysM peptidoglycan-binding domain-containing protein [Gammaproteobacteria bacterium]